MQICQMGEPFSHLYGMFEHVYGLWVRLLGKLFREQVSSINEFSVLLERPNIANYIFYSFISQNLIVTFPQRLKG